MVGEDAGGTMAGDTMGDGTDRDRDRDRSADSVTRTGTFADRVEAGRLLAEHLECFRAARPVVLGLPRGGVCVAYQVADALDAPLDIIVVRKLGVPSQPELAMGAIGENGVTVVDRWVFAQSGVGHDRLAEVEARERQQLAARLRLYRRGRQRCDLTDRAVIVVDDGVATGSTASVACKIARMLGASPVVLAVPVGPADIPRLVEETDEVVVLDQPENFAAVGHHYVDFSPTGDDEVVALLDRSARRHRVGTSPARSALR
jgi:putative phosphoribosyl transferase